MASTSLLASAAWLGAFAFGQQVRILATSEISVGLSASRHAPRLAWLAGGGATRANRAIELLPASVEIEGTPTAVTWTHLPDRDVADSRRVALIFESTIPRLRATWEWEARGLGGPVEHRIRIENLGDRELWLPLVDSLRLDWGVPPSADLANFYVEKGAGAPSDQGVHLDSLGDGYHWIGTSSTYAHPGAGQAREIIPAEVVFSRRGGQEGWYAGIEFSGRTRILLERNRQRLQSVLGLNPDPGPFRTRLRPGEGFETPTAFLGAFAGGADGAGNQLRPWVRAVLGNPLTWKDPRYPLVVNNSWGAGMAVDERIALHMIEESAQLGVEMFHLDAGWFRGVGDWYPEPSKFPRGLAFLADQAHALGLRFGIWADWTQAALDTEPGALNARDPKVRDWLVADLAPGWKPEEFKGQTVDIGVPAAHDALEKEVDRLVDDYHLDMLEQDGYLVAQGCARGDHPHAPPAAGATVIEHDAGADFVLSSNQTDVSYHAARSYYDIYEHTRRAHPGLLLEICNDGGRMVDFGSAAHGDYFSMTDAYDPVSNRRAFYDASYLLPAPMLESYVERWPAPSRENFLYMLRSGMMGWLTLMLDTGAWTADEHRTAREAIALYQSRLRPLIREARLYHVSARPDGVHWDGMEYWDPARRQGVLYAFRGSAPGEAEHRFRLRGLEPEKRYRLHFQDGSSSDRLIAGKELARPGLAVVRKQALSSELIFFAEDAGAR